MPEFPATTSAAPAFRRPGDDPDLLTFGADVPVERRIRAHVGEINGAGENALDGAWPGVEREPPDGYIRTEARFEPSLVLT